ncbi:transcriptional repressor LexA [Rubrobacter indicoceani]|uniref:transcriptional repressor LexA n=1 Tax=Rubrobacter indicoceani TaxID=2051957 RepID=UPI0023E13924|nr:transcriptional repressor LexA [Rubrobacter indicoceani]
MSDSIHPKRLAILRAVARSSGGGEMPTVRELADSVGLSSAQTVHYHLGILEEEGYIERGDAPSRKRRPLRLTGRGWEVVGQAPMPGRVAAGRGLEAVAEDDYYSLNQVLGTLGGRRRYLLRVVGQSMTGAGIEDGDLLVVEEREDPPDGSVVVALIGGGDEVTVKKLYRERGEDGEMVRLVPKNGDHRDIMLPADEVRVQGEVVFVIHPPRR